MEQYVQFLTCTKALCFYSVQVGRGGFDFSNFRSKMLQNLYQRPRVVSSLIGSTYGVSMNY